MTGTSGNPAYDLQRPNVEARVVATPEDIIDYDDGPGGPVWGYDWRAHFVADVAALALALGAAAGLLWLSLA